MDYLKTTNSSLLHGYIKTKLDAAKQVHVFRINFNHKFITPPRVFVLRCTQSVEFVYTWIPKLPNL